MFKLCSYITIGTFLFTYVNEVEIESSWQSMTDKATIKLPRNLKLKFDNLRDIIRQGDIVQIKLGYDNNLIEEFRGYVTAVKPTIPLEIECEDGFYMLKRIQVKPKSWRQVDLNDVVKYICPGVKHKTLPAELGAFRIDQDTNTAAKVLAKIKEAYGLYSFFRKGVLIIGLEYDPETQQEAVFNLQKNVPENGISDLEFLRKEDVKIKVKAISMTPDNKERTIILGDKDSDAEERTLHCGYNMTKEALKKFAEQQMSRLKYDGYRGGFTAFGIPVVRHGDIADIINEEYPEQDGKYHIMSTVKTFGQGGYRQKIKLDNKAS